MVLARAADPFSRGRTRRRSTSRSRASKRQREKRIGRARFAVYGHGAYPDATFTLRLSYGQVKGYPMNGTIAPLEDDVVRVVRAGRTRSTTKPPFELPRALHRAARTLDLSTPMNFVTTNDIIGGNSGSPVVNRAGEFVGIIFDGNIESLVGRFVYSEESNRAVAVHSAVILEALRKLYDAGALADELLGAR